MNKCVPLDVVNAIHSTQHAQLHKHTNTNLQLNDQSNKQTQIHMHTEIERET